MGNILNGQTERLGFTSVMNANNYYFTEFKIDTSNVETREKQGLRTYL
jgi:hypothetical protein